MRHLHFESLETRRLLTGTPEMLYRGAICSVTESRTAGVAFITDAGTLDACGRNASPQVLRRTDGTAEGSYRLGPSRTDNHIKPETIVEAGESVYFVQGNNSAGGLQTLHTAALDGSHAETLIWHQGGDTYYRSGLDRNGTYIVAQAVERLDPETGKRTSPPDCLPTPAHKRRFFTMETIAYFTLPGSATWFSSPQELRFGKQMEPLKVRS